MRMREGLPYMLIGGAVALTIMGLSKNDRLKDMVNDAMMNIKRNGMDELEDMM